MNTGTHTWETALDACHQAGLLRDLDLRLTKTLARTHGVAAHAAPAGALAVALASRVVGDGHICLDFNQVDAAWLAGLSDVRGASAVGAEIVMDDLLSAVQSPEWYLVVGGPDDAKPCVLDDRRLYLRRMYDYERQTARRLHQMAGATAQTLAPAAEAAIGELLSDPCQQQAARMALTRRLTVISGAPGTGKTFTAARILALLSRYAADGAPLRVRLAAPTGKAAARLEESIAQARATTRDATAGTIVCEPACTLERLLGYRADSPYFRHDASRPLDADIVLVDEASMIDLPKMAKLLDAIGPATRLVLLGDSHQLASVQPGSVLAEVCEAQRLSGCVATLQNSFRFAGDSPVGRLSRAINEADDAVAARTAWRSVSDPAAQEDEYAIRVHEVPERLETGGGRTTDAFVACVRRGYADFLAADTPAAVFAALEKFRVLCALRHGPFGALAVNRLIEAALPSLNPREEWYSHRVVMVTRNDYGTRLFNGDVGVVLPDPERLDGERVVYFETSANAAKERFRKVPCRLLPPHETAFAITIHKAQGSEFGRILVLLPAADVPLLTKELLYTALTRTRSGVDLWCNEGPFVRAACRRMRRLTGLKTQIDRQADTAATA